MFFSVPERKLQLPTGELCRYYTYPANMGVGTGFLVIVQKANTMKGALYWANEFYGIENEDEARRKLNEFVVSSIRSFYEMRTKIND